MTSISSAKPIFEILENTRTDLSWNYGVFYSLTLLTTILLALPILAYLFPEKKKQLLRKWKKGKK
jgi:hypothetical protein